MTPAFLESVRFWAAWLVVMGAGAALTIWFLSGSPPPVAVILLGAVGVGGCLVAIREMTRSGRSVG